VQHSGTYLVRIRENVRVLTFALHVGSDQAKGNALVMKAIGFCFFGRTNLLSEDGSKTRPASLPELLELWNEGLREPLRRLEEEKRAFEDECKCTQHSVQK